MWYYIQAGESQGPFDERSFDDLVARGIISSDSLVWNETLTGWVSLSQARPALSIPVTANSTCNLCQANVGADNLIDLAGVRVCAACKPLAVQKIREGVGLTGGNTVWRDGKKLVIQDKTHLPARCVKCNAETSEPPLTRKLQWHHPAYYLLILISILIYIIVAVCIRKRATTEAHLCRNHLQRRRGFLIGAWVGVGVAIIVFFTGAVMNIAGLTVASIIIFIGAIIVGFAGSLVVRTTRIKGQTVWLSGAGPAFLDSLPQWPG